MPETVILCPLCQGNESSLFDRRTFAEVPVENRLCSRCGFVFQSPRMSADESATFYAREYRPLYQGSAGPNAKDLVVQAARAEELLRFTRRSLPRVQRFLDIGCSAGLLLKAFSQANGCQVVGIEPGEAYRDYATASGFNVYTSLEAMEDSCEARFDLVSLAHVLEHLPDPVGSLIHLREAVLQPDGWLLLEVPNLYVHDSFEVAHLEAFSAHTLKETLRKAGYRLVRMRKHGQPRSSILPFYLTALCQPTSGLVQYVVRPEMGVKLKRKVGQLYRKVALRLLPSLAWRRLPGETGERGEA